MSSTDTRLLNIGRAWDNSSIEGRSNKAPKLRIAIDRDLGLAITLKPESQLLLFTNQKRAGKKDADYRVAVELPKDIVDAQLAKRGSSRQATLPGVAVA